MSEFSEGFLAFWKAYPRKQAKPKAWESWRKQKCEESWRGIVRHVEERAKSDRQWRDGFIPMPTTFLNQQRWLDEGWEAKKPRNESPSKQPDEVSAWKQPDNWKAELNMWLLEIVRKARGLELDELRRKVVERNRLAAQCHEMFGSRPLSVEDKEVLRGMRRRLEVA